MLKKALLIIDMLNDFVKPGAPLEVSGAGKIVKNIKVQIDKAMAEGTAVIYVCDFHDADDPEFRIWPPHAVSGTKGAEIIDEIAAKRSDIIIQKKTYSGFFETELDEVLKRLGVEEIILTGVCTEICVLYTAADAYMRGYSVAVPEDCVAGLTEDAHRFALRQIKDVLKPRPRK